MKRPIKKLWPILVSIGSTTVMILTFFIPSVQDQWDRYQSRQIIQEYTRMGDELFNEEKFDMAEQAYTKAFELSAEQRLDIELKRLRSKVSRMNLEAEWGVEPPEDIEEVDFQYLLHIQSKAAQKNERASTLNCYGFFLASKDRTEEAERAFREALVLVPDDVLCLINYGNLLDQLDRKKEAEHYYKKAIDVDSGNETAHYNLALLYVEQGKAAEAITEFQSVIKTNPENTDARHELDSLAALK